MDPCIGFILWTLAALTVIAGLIGTAVKASLAIAMIGLFTFVYFVS